MWENSEGVTDFFLHDEFNATQRSRNYCSSRHYSLIKLFIATLFVESTDIVHPGRIYFCIFIYFKLLHKHAIAHIKILKMYGK